MTNQQYHSGAFNVRSSIVGQALVDAYLAAESQSWSGGVVTASALAAYQSQLDREHGFVPVPDCPSSIRSLEQDGLVCKYKIPMKAGTELTQYDINWASTPVGGNGLTNELIRGNMLEFADKPHSSRVEEIVKNTEAFLERFWQCGNDAPW